MYKVQSREFIFSSWSERVQGTWTLGNSVEKKSTDVRKIIYVHLPMFSEVIFQYVEQSIRVNQHHLFEGKEFVSTLWQLSAFLSSFGQWENCKWFHISFTVKHSCALGESVSQNKREVSLVTDVFYCFKQSQTSASGSWFCHAF